MHGIGGIFFEKNKLDLDFILLKSRFVFAVFDF